jgi:energy-coupling factor transport system permease protein
VIRSITPVKGSFLHLLDFRPKLVLLLVIMTVCLIWNDPFLQFGLLLSVLGLCLNSKISFRYLTFIIGLMVPFLLVMVLIHGFFNTVQLGRLIGEGDFHWLVRIPDDWLIFRGKGLTLEGVLYGLNVGLKSTTLLLAFPMVVLTTDIDKMLAGLVRLKVPFILAFIFSASMRFFPLLFADAQTMIEAQRLRGIAVEEMNLLRRTRVYARTVVPLILMSLIRSQQLEIALYSKAFSVIHGRTALHEVNLTFLDWVVILVSFLILLVVLVLMVFYGVGKFQGL